MSNASFETIEELVNAITSPEKADTKDQQQEQHSEPKPKERLKGWKKAIEEKAEIAEELQEIEEKCGSIRGLTVCVDDEVIVNIGRYWWSGRVLAVSKFGLVISNSSHETAIALGKINVLQIARRGEWFKKWRELKGR